MHETEMYQMLLEESAGCCWAEIKNERRANQYFKPQLRK